MKEQPAVRPAEAVAPARPASSVILARPAGFGYELFMVRRPARAAAFADAFVFPGGGVRAGDGEPSPVDGRFTGADAYRGLSERGGVPPKSDAEALGFYRAALRELFEEAGILLARDRHGEAATIPEADAAVWDERRKAVQSKRVAFTDLVSELDLTLDHSALTYFSHWITPSTEARRFDTRFFMALGPEGQAAAHCDVETIESVWIAPAAALEQDAADQFPLVYPTRRHLEVLAARPRLADLLAFARSKPIRTVQPERAPTPQEENLPLDLGEGPCW